MQHFLAFVGLGGNLGDSLNILKEALNQIRALDKVTELRTSSFYTTTPVSTIPQGLYVNAVCCFETTYSPQELLLKLQSIEVSLGKIAKPKDYPRPIDLDILFFGLELIDSAELQIPHPRWRERLFVLKPLSEIVELIRIPNQEGGLEHIILKEELAQFTNQFNETVIQER